MKTKFLFLSLFISLSCKIYACKCPEPFKINYFDFQFNDLIFLGKCERIINKGKDVYAVFTIEKVFKGEYKPKTIELLTSNNRGADCMSTYEPQERWFNLVNLTPKGYGNNRCGKSSRFNKAILNDFENFSNISKSKDKTISLLNEKTVIKVRIIDGLSDGIWTYSYMGKLKMKIKYTKGKIDYYHDYDDKEIKYQIDKYSNGKLLEQFTLNEQGKWEKAVKVKYYSNNHAEIKFFSASKLNNSVVINLATGTFKSNDGKTGNFYTDRPISRVNPIEQMFFPKHFP
ncbi:hypothetical protein GCM10027035_12370 [Emticicia sediminis]